MLGLAASGSLFLLTSTSPAAAQTPPATPPALSIAGDVSKPTSFSPSDLKAMPRQKAEVKAEDGTPRVYEGVLVGEFVTSDRHCRKSSMA